MFEHDEAASDDTGADDDADDDNSGYRDNDVRSRCIVMRKISWKLCHEIKILFIVSCGGWSGGGPGGGMRSLCFCYIFLVLK